MAKVGMSSDQRTQSIFDVDTFKLDKGQRARILVIETEFEVEYTHWVENVGYVVCHGDYNTLLKNGEDPQHCPFCRKAAPGGKIGGARRKFATLLIVYRTNKQGQLVNPVYAECLPWVFGDDKFNDLVGKKEQWGDLRNHDIVVECTGEKFQKFKMEICPDAVWLKDPNLKMLVAGAYKEARDSYSKDLRRLLGRDVTDEEKITEIRDSAIGTSTVPEYASAEDIGAVLGGAGVGAVIPPATGVDFGALLNNPPPAEVPPATVAPAAPVQQPAAVPPPAAQPVTEAAPFQAAGNPAINFDDFLK